MNQKLIYSFLFFLVFNLNAFAQSQNHRLVVLSDIEADPDDSQSLVRLLLYSNKIDIEALIATTSTHQRKKVVPETMHEIINAYGKVQSNLLKHEAGFPSADYLNSIVSKGLPIYGMAAVGKGHDSEGSEKIIEVIDREDDRPIYISVWGGPNTLAQALWKLRETRSKNELKEIIAKLRVYTISDQDDSGIWIRNNFPDLFFIVSPGGYFRSTWIAINRPIKGIDNTTISNSWLAENIQQNHGPLGAMYPDVAYGMEGDTPAYLNLIPNGLSNPERPNWGGWGGRYEYYLPKEIPTQNQATGGVPIEQETRAIWTNAEDEFSPRVPNEFGQSIRKDSLVFKNNWVSLWRWRDDFQRDFAARMDWTFKSYEEANHAPVIQLTIPDEITVHSGDKIDLDAKGTYDPDGDSMSYWWFPYLEAGTFKGKISFGGQAENLYNQHDFIVPEVDSPQTLHFILKVTDKGSPAMSSYKRVILNILPKN